MNIKNKILYYFFLIFFILIIFSILFGALLKYHYEGGQKFKLLRHISVFLADVPSNATIIFNKKSIGEKVNKPKKLSKHNGKNRFTKYSKKENFGLLVLPRYDHSISRSVVDIIDLKNFNTIHTYAHNILQMNKNIKDERHRNIHIDDSPVRFEYRHPMIFEDGTLISHSDYAPLFKIDFCSNLLWINEETKFHHSLELDSENNIYVGGQLKPFSKYISESEWVWDNWMDDAIIKVNKDGKIIYTKSIAEIMIENELIDDNLFKYEDPIHLNDVEPALFDSEFWKKDDVFLSLRHQSIILHYRPSSNKLINILKGPFSQQHDVDIISKEEISIFNNNNFLIDNQSSELLIYNFRTNKYKNKFKDQLENLKFKTVSQGLSQVLIDGSIVLEEQNHGRIVSLSKSGSLNWEYINKDDSGDIGFVSWSRIIEEKNFVNKFKDLIKQKKCLN